ncbi:hypothetical protein [Paraflavitalea pollutisoli]|uniref:hypothetical protein n=1 Tax=Paraflavitalea pollutisoli TaxID=3034143 RepID=UPI0023EB7C9F|nr:hypothetical protein [Paraflavitalea sp. H1-2-19X]
MNYDSLANLPSTVPGYFTTHLKFNGWNFFYYVAGILITAFSLSAGAPFWFDMLMKVVNLRRAGARPAETKTNAS